MKHNFRRMNLNSGAIANAAVLFAIPTALLLASALLRSGRTFSSCRCCEKRSSQTTANNIENRVRGEKSSTGGATIDAGVEDDDVFEVFVAPSDRFKFNAAHFIAYKGFRERLHGHNYSVSITLIGRGKLGPDGYLLDFGDVKDVVSKLCKELNEHFLLPLLSDALEVKLDEHTCELLCEDGTRFTMPRDDVVELPVVHSSAEELARYLWTRIVQKFTVEALEQRNVVTVQVSVAEMPNQQATFRRHVRDASAPLCVSKPLTRGCTPVTTDS